MAKALMIQGTMSNAGKSLIAAGLCRVFKQDGYKVAPFKAQNMALNSFITREGLEMGRAQVVQAEAAGVEPSVLMNPILLKPTTDMGSQIILNGEVWGQLSAQDYFAQKKKLLPEVLKAYQTLSDQNDAIIIEGAGSPVEINLKDSDVYVNMDMAKAAKAPVLLVGDVDRGGVFAQLYGTVALFTEEERAMVKGVIIIKFRGEQTI
ncbi:MAG: cobyric acid synthase, partial [Mogibacterium sp.]|nr:cobyric acid synthase [Mogibacterium sp.]